MSLPEVRYVYSGLFETDSEWIHPTRTENTWEIICVSDGVVHLCEKGECFDLEKGDVILLEPGVEHSGSKISNGSTSFFWLHFTCDDFSALGIGSRVIRGFSGSAALRQLMHVANSTGYPVYAADSLLLALLAELARASYERYGEECSGAQAKIVRECAEWIRINSERKLTVGEVARRTGYNGEYLSRLFRQIYGITLGRYISESRVRLACELLCGTALTVGEVAFRLGFGSENQFIQFFKYHKGISPSMLRGSSANIHMNNS